MLGFPSVFKRTNGSIDRPYFRTMQPRILLKKRHKINPHLRRVGVKYHETLGQDRFSLMSAKSQSQAQPTAQVSGSADQ